MRTSAACLPVLLLSACATSTQQPIIESMIFVSERSGDGDVYALNLDDRSLMPLITSAAREGTPVWDRARARIVYQTDGDDGVDLYSDQQRIMRDPGKDAPPSWSPDGTTIVFAANRDGQDNLFLARVDGSGERRLTDGRFTDRFPAFSPNGQRVVFARRDDIGWDLHSIDVTSGETTRHTLDGVYVGHPVWSPSGDLVAFDRHWGEQADIAILDISSGVIQRLTTQENDDLQPAFSLDGQRVAFTSFVDGAWNLWEVGTDALNLRQLTNSRSLDGAPVYVPRKLWFHLVLPSPPADLE